MKVDLTELAGYLTKARIFIAGAGGSIGSELCRPVAGCKPEILLLLSRGDNSIGEIDQALFHSFPELFRIPISGNIRDQGKNLSFSKYTGRR